jgi:hypothetical protein
MRRGILTGFVPPHITLCLEHIGLRETTKLLLNLISVSSLFEQPNVSLSKAAAMLEGGVLAVVMTRELLLTHNPDPEEFHQFPYLLASGPALAGKVRGDLSIEQIGDVDLSEVLYANAA